MMNKLLISAGAVAALALTSAPAAATPVSASANAHAHIYRPLTIAQKADMDFGTIVLSGTAPYTDTLTVNSSGTVGGCNDVTCSGTTSAGVFTLTGTKNSTAAISLASSTITLTGSNSASDTLSLSLTAPTTVALGTTGNTGTDFAVTGSMQVKDTTPDDLYTGSFTVNADYQ